MMKVSVLVPIYNVEQYIAQCAESLLAQTYKDVEYIFVNDCTPDRSIEVLREVVAKHPERKGQINIINQDRNRGSGAARLKAMKHATGDFVMFVDSDDFVPVDAIENLVKRQQETGADMVDGATDSFAGGKLFDVQLPYKKNDYVKLLIIQNVVPHHLWGRLIRRSLFIEHDINFKEGVNQAEDYSIMPRIAYYAKRAWTDEVVYHYRVDRVGTFTDNISQRHVKSFLTAHKIIFSFFKGKDREYQYPLHVGLINASYRAVQAGMAIADVNDMLGYKPRGLFRLASFLLSNKATQKLARLDYLVMKRMYVDFTS